MRIANYKELGKLYKAHGAAQATAMLQECLHTKDPQSRLDPSTYSLREAFQWLCFDRQGDPVGREGLEQMNPARNGLNLLESGGAVESSAFANITGQIVYSKILEAYAMPGLLWPQLCTTIPTQFSGEKIPGISGLGDEAESIGEGKPYPTIGVSQEYIETPETTKKGFVVPVTKEAIFFDRTGLLLQRCSAVGEWAGVAKEKEVLDVVLGQVNPYKWNGTAYNTYYTTGGHGTVNAGTNALNDYTDIDEANQKFSAMTDPWTGEPIMVIPNTLLVPPALLMKALRIVNATQVALGPNNTATAQTFSPNPLTQQAVPAFTVLTNPFVKARLSSDVYWHYGDPKKAFAYMQNWDVQTEQSDSNSEVAFTHDVVQRYKVSWRGVMAVMDPRQMYQSTGAS
jgi:hypothetical protein